MIHANGDKAIDFTLEAYTAALAGNRGLMKGTILNTAPS